jgi:type IV pilus assembly protein PilM
MIRLTRAQPQPIGLDIGFDSVKMLQLEAVGGVDGCGSLRVVAAAREAMPEEVRAQPDLRLAAAVDIVRRMLQQHPFRGRHVVACVPREILHAKNLRLPQIPPHELSAAIEFEARTVFDFDATRAHIRHLPAGEVRQGAEVRQEVIVLAARHQDVDAFLEQLHRAGAIVDSLDVEACALYRTVERFIRRREDEQEVHVLVDIGARRTQVIVGRGRDISFYKPIDIGAMHLLEATSVRLGISPGEARALKRRIIESGELPGAAERTAVSQAVYDATRGRLEELGREISLCLRYYSVTFRGQRPARARLLGGEANNPHVESVLASALPIPVEAGRPLCSVDTSRMRPSDRAGGMPEWALAMGLGMRMASGPFAPRDGTPREMQAAAAANGRSAAAAEVVDLNQAMLDPGSGVNDSRTAAPQAGEAVHA